MSIKIQYMGNFRWQSSWAFLYWRQSYSWKIWKHTARWDCASNTDYRWSKL